MPPKPPSPREIVASLRQTAKQEKGQVRSQLEQAATIIDHLLQQLQPKVDARGNVEFVVTSGYAATKQEPFVQIQIAGQVHQLSPEAARGHAMHILEAAEAASTDALFFEFCLEHMDLDLDKAGKLLVAMRSYRQKRDGKRASSA